MFVCWRPLRHQSARCSHILDLQVHSLRTILGYMQLGAFGIWQPSALTTVAIAREIETLGYSALWIGGESPDLAHARELLTATDNLVIGTSIVNIWQGDPATTAKACLQITEGFPDRFLLGLGVGHREQTGHYAKPLAALNQYLDVLDKHGVPVQGRALAALGPRTLELAHQRAGGVVPYLVTPEHTRRARRILGDGLLVAPEQKVVVDGDAERARAQARPRIKHPYLGLVNYTNNLRRLGFTDEDLAGEGSDELIDQLVIHGDAETVVRGLNKHLEAGADHVQIQVIGSRHVPHPQISDVYIQVYDEDVFATYRKVAAALKLAPA
jgi:probable F420-dependent oxidoreductase